MGNFSNSAITDAGRGLLAEAQAGAVFTPTRIVIGSGSIPTGKTAQTTTDVVAAVKSLPVIKRQRTPDGKAIFGSVYSNEDITEAFYFRELALYAKPVHLNEDGSVASEGAEVLYTYGNAGNDADFMPAYSTNTVVEKQLDIVTYVGNNTQVNLTVESGTYVTKEEMGAANGVATLDSAGKLAQMPTANDVGAAPANHNHDGVYSKTNHSHTPADIGAAPASHNHDGVYSKTNHTHTPAAIGAVPATRKINGKALSADITLVATDVGAAVTATHTITVTTAWTASGDDYYQDLAVNGILATDNPIPGVAYGSDNAANKLYDECFGKVLHITTSASKVRVWASEAISSAFPLQLKVVR